jgi:3-(3-hydroxy-phenyl)propionate hydroxylase
MANRRARKTEHAVVIAGGGPTGMMLAGELALAGVDVAIVERRTSAALAGSRAGGLHARAIEVLDQRGIADRFVSEGQIYPVMGFHRQTLDLSDFPSRRNYVLGLFQNHIERILAGWIDELKIPTYRGREVTGFDQDDTGVNIDVSDGSALHAEYLVGCDGGRSVVRKAAGIEFPGWDATTSWLIAEIRWTDEPKWGFHEDAAGMQAIGRMDDPRVMRAVLTERQPAASGEPTLEEFREALVAAYGTDFGIHSPIWVSRFSDMARQAAEYRVRRVLLAGDAAHVHAPIGGQGLNIGLQDAVNLGWKLAQVVKGISPERLLDTYHAERHPIGARVLRNTMAQVFLRRTDDHAKALGDYVAEFLGMDEPRRSMAGEMSGLGVHYDLGEGHPLLGRRMPDLDVVTAKGPLRVYTLLHAARPVLLNFGQSGSLAIAPWADRVQLVDAEYGGAWELPVLGPVAAPDAVLVRPDGYVAWVQDRTPDGLTEALEKWFGPPVSPWASRDHA